MCQAGSPGCGVPKHCEGWQVLSGRQGDAARQAGAERTAPELWAACPRGGAQPRSSPSLDLQHFHSSGPLTSASRFPRLVSHPSLLHFSLCLSQPQLPRSLNFCFLCLSVLSPILSHPSPTSLWLVSLCLPLWPISLSLSAPLRDLAPSPLHFCLFPIPVPSLSLHLSISPPSTRPRFGSGCVTFTRPFSAAVSTETSSGAGEGGDKKQTHPFPGSTGPSASRPPTSPSTGISHFLSWGLGS